MISSPAGESFSSRSGASLGARSSGSFAAICASQLSQPAANANHPPAPAAGSIASPEPVSKTPPGTVNPKSSGKNSPPPTANATLVAVLQVPVPAAPEIASRVLAGDFLADPLSLLTAAVNAAGISAQPPADASTLVPSATTSSVMATSQPVTLSPTQQQSDTQLNTGPVATPQDLIRGSVAEQAADNTGPALVSIPQTAGLPGSPVAASSGDATAGASSPAPQQSTAQTSPASGAPSSANAPGDNNAPPKILPQAFVSAIAIPPNNPQPRTSQTPSPVTLPAVVAQPSSGVAQTLHSGLHSLAIEALASSASEFRRGTSSNHVAPAFSNAISTSTSAQNVESNQDSTNQDSQSDTDSDRPLDSSLHKSVTPVPAPRTEGAAGAPPVASPQVAAGVAPPATVPVVDPAMQLPVNQPTTSASAHKSDLPGSGSSWDTASNLPASGETPAAPTAGPVQMAQMVSKAAQSEMRIGMNTSAFGSVEVRTVVHANEVGVLIGSEKGDLRSLLSTELPGIANTLQQQNLRLNQVNFHQGFAFSNNQSSGGDSQPHSFTSRPMGKTAHAAELSSPESSEPAPLLSNGHGSGLSILA